MGKIKVATLGSDQEAQLREKQRVKREEKKKREHSRNVHVKGMKGGERVKSVGAESEEELNKMAKLAQEVEKDQTEGLVLSGGEGIKVDEKKEPAKRKKVRIRSQRYKQVLMKVEPNKLFSFSDAVILLRQVTLTKFDASVELHMNTIEKGLRGVLQLPHGTGKKVRVMIADGDSIDKIVESVEKGKVEFDALVAHPSVMAKLAKVAKFLGPRGLMPNPKNGTISATPEKVAKKLEAGEITWKTEPEFPIIHQVIGKMSFKDSQLSENFQALMKSIGEEKIKSITLKSTMSPGIKVQTN